MKLLVELGADPYITTRNGTTALMASAGVGSFAPEEEAGNEEECLAAVKYCVSLGLDQTQSIPKGKQLCTEASSRTYLPWSII